MDPKAGRHFAKIARSDLRVSAIVVAGAGARAVELCVRAALADPWVDELVVVDTGMEAGVAAALRALRADRRNLRLLKAAGVAPAEAANLGAAHARGKFLLFLEPGVVLRRGAAARLVSAGRRATPPWIAGGRLLDARGRERPSVRRGHPTPLTALFGAGRLIRVGLSVRRPAPVAAVSGDLFLIPRFDFEALGGFDVDGVDTLEALDLCHRATLAGGEVRFAPQAEGISFAQVAGRRAQGAAAAREADSLARYVSRGATSPVDRASAALARPVLRTYAVIKTALRIG